MKNALEDAIAYFDNKPGLFAKAIGEKPSVVSNWRARGQVAADKCRKVEMAVNYTVTVHDLRPDIFGPAPDAAA